MSGALYIVAPEGQPWPLDLDAAEARFRQHWPEAHITRQVSAVNGSTYLSFDVRINDMARWGTYTGGTCLSLVEGSPADWADTIAWFLGLLPADSPVLATVEGIFTLTPLSSVASADEVREFFERLMQA